MDVRRTETLRVVVDGAVLDGLLELPEAPRGVVVFADAERDDDVAERLHAVGFGTLQVDLLRPDERRDARRRLDVWLLAHRLAAATDTVARHSATRDLPVGYLGGDAGAAAALVAALDRPRVKAIVCRAGRPDLAEGILDRVTTPTALVAGDRDEAVLRLNEAASAQLRCAHELVAVPGAGRRFEEPGMVDTVGQLAVQWFLRYLDEEASGDVPCQ
jgi:putative phosphoribosyl transferase